MSSEHRACIGLDEAFDSFVEATDPAAVRLGSRGRETVRRWEDPGSGARWVASYRKGHSAHGRPEPGVVDAGVPGPGGTGGWERIAATVLGPGGEEVTRLTFFLEQCRLRPALPAPGGPASVVALGIDVVVRDGGDPGTPGSGASPGSCRARRPG